MPSTSGPSAAFRSVARITESICNLPAVATLDWADVAAGCFTPIAEPCRVCVMICSADETGRIASLEATGVAASGHDTAARDDSSASLALRSRAERLTAIGCEMSLTRLASGLFGSLDTLLAGPDWRTVGIGKMWEGLPAGEVLMGAAALGDVEPGRMLLVQVGTSATTDPSIREDRLAIMRVVFPMLIKRASVAVGPARTTSARWLTGREQEVLEHLTLGKSVRQIAEEIERSQHTVHDHVKSLHRKLSASSRGELVARALGHIISEVDGQAERNVAEVGTTRAASLPTSSQEAEVSSNGSAER